MEGGGGGQTSQVAAWAAARPDGERRVASRGASTRQILSPSPTILPCLPAWGGLAFASDGGQNMMANSRCQALPRAGRRARQARRVGLGTRPRVHRDGDHAAGPASSSGSRPRRSPRHATPGRTGDPGRGGQDPPPTWPTPASVRFRHKVQQNTILLCLAFAPATYRACTRTAAPPQLGASPASLPARGSMPGATVRRGQY